MSHVVVITVTLLALCSAVLAVADAAVAGISALLGARFIAQKVEALKERERAIAVIGMNCYI